MPLPSLRRLLLLSLLALPVAAWADESDAGEDAGATEDFLDASIPDASVGGGGADRDNPEGEDGTGRVNTVCRQSADCDRGFSCNDKGRCVYVGVRKADGGCLLGATTTPLLLGVLALTLAARRR